MFRLRVYEWYEKLRYASIGPWQRETGKQMALAGLRMQGPMKNDDQGTNLIL